MSGNKIEVIARVVILRKGKILLAQLKGDNFYFLPGGHMEPGESPEEAIRRELKEEINAAPKNIQLLGIVENQYSKKGRKKYEINLVYSAAINRKNVEALENHLVFKWELIANLKRVRMLPAQLKKRLLAFVKTKRF